MALMVAATIMVALVVRVGSDTDPFPVAIPGEAAALEASPLAMSGEPPHCGLKYAAVLDLAELGRSYGKESQTYRRAVDKVSGKVSGKANDCRIGARV
ncbi:hypothetical protein D0B32_24605 [Paraburkholderia sp. DHOC27]|nr:hypothetical protein D0B32_24605 [Paraburkholderia sp. DHOC27]